jgi:hypothetical protein
VSNEFEDRAQEESEFDEYLRRGSAVSQRYHELGGRAVPPTLDAKVLQQAQQHAAQRARHSRAWLRWGAPLAFAATALIAVTVVLQPDVQEASAPAASIEQPVASDYEAAAAAQQQGAVGEAAPALEAPARNESAEPKRATAPRPAASEADSLGTASSRPESRALLDRSANQAAAPERDERLARSAPAATPSVPEPVSEQARATAPSDQEAMKQSARSPRSDDKLEEAGGTRRQSNVEREAVPDAVVERPKAAVERERNVQLLRTPQAQPAPAPPAPAGPPAAATMPPPEPAAEGVATLEVDRTTVPAIWVKWIRDLRAQGKPERAEELLKRLRAAHPSFQVPADIAPTQR